MTISRQAVLDKIDAIAQEATLAAQLDITQSALATALAGAVPKTQAEMWTRLDQIHSILDAGITTITGTVNVGANVLAADAATETEQGLARAVMGDIKTGVDTINTGVNTTITPTAIFEIANVPVVAAATRVQLNADLSCNQVIITAEKGNTDSIYVGDVTVTNAIYGVELGPGEQITIPVSNANKIYIDAVVNGEGVSYIAT